MGHPGVVLFVKSVSRLALPLVREAASALHCCGEHVDAGIQDFMNLLFEPS